MFPIDRLKKNNIALALILLLSRHVNFLSGFVIPARPVTFGSVVEFSQNKNVMILQNDVGIENESSSSSEVNGIPSTWKEEVLDVLKDVIDPDLDNDIVSLGFVKNLVVDESSGRLSFDVELTTPACPVKDQFQEQCKELASSLDWTNEVEVTMTAAPSPSNPGAAVSGMNQIGAVIAVSSCKGGVGKSTTAVNLAYALRSLGASVGIFDADFYGPSLPTMVTPDDDTVRFVGRQIAPLKRDGVSLMSFGYVNEGSAVMRGPMITQLLDQFLSLTQWGQLDYLIIDMPPGTGDIQLTLSQRLNITAAVIVTTPQELSFVDVERGIEMFDTVNVPCIAVVENMAYFETESNNNKNSPMIDQTQLYDAFLQKLKDNNISPKEDGKNLEDVCAEFVDIVQQFEKNVQKENEKETNEKIRIFGPGHRERLSRQWGIEHTYSVPLLGNIAQNGDSGTPYILEFPESPQAQTYREIGESVAREVSKLRYNQLHSRPSTIYNSEENVFSFEGFDTFISSANLRRDCKCASCVEELSGRQILQPSDVSENIRPLKIEPCGNYALSVDWSDGHRSLYPFRQIKSLLQQTDEIVETKLEVPQL